VVTDDDRQWFQFQRERLEGARRRRDQELYNKIYHDMLTTARQLVADQRWWEFWSNDEACTILQGVLAVPPYLGDPSPQQVQRDLAVHQRIGTTLAEQIKALETAKLVVEIVDHAATAASIAIGAGTAAVAIRELVKRLGVREAGKLLAREFVKAQIKQAVQDQAIDGLAHALGADPTTAHLARDLVLALEDARKSPLIAKLPARPGGLIGRMEPTVSPSTTQRLKEISVQVTRAKVVEVPRWQLQKALDQLPETERAVYELRAAMVEATQWRPQRRPLAHTDPISAFVERSWTGAVGRRLSDGKLIFASSGAKDNPRALAVMEQIAKKYGGEVLHDPKAKRLLGSSRDPGEGWRRRVYDAEAKILWAAELDEIGATRVICHDCQSVLDRFPRTTPLTPLKPR
jgi:hypothetical protein